MGGYSTFKPLMIALIFMVGVTSLAKAQDFPPCADKLTPCVDYLNSTNPPASCCNPLLETAATQLPCLCDLFSTPGLLEGAGVNITKAIQLTHRCGITTDLTNCKAAAPSPSETVSPPAAPPPSETTSPPATRGGGSDNGGTGRVTWTGLYFLLVFWASMLFN